MENPAQEIKDVVRTLTQGSPDAQRQTIYRYFAPGAAFEHPFCRVPSFNKVNVPGIGSFDSRALITAIYKWYKILSPRIELDIESCAHDEQANILYLSIFQVFSIWFIPFYRAPVRLVAVVHLAEAPASSDGGGGQGQGQTASPPPPYDAAQEKLQAVQEGAEPSYAAVAAGDASASQAGDENQNQNQNQNGNGNQAASKAEGESSSAGGGGGGGPKRYVITKQQDLYQVTEFLKFVALAPGSVAARALQLLATLLCALGAALLGPFVRAVWPPAANVAKGVAGKGKKQA